MMTQTKHPIDPDDATKPPQGRGRLQALLILLLPVALLVLATWMYYSGVLLPAGRVNNGALIIPPVDLTVMQARDEAGNLLDANSLEGEWGMLVLTESDCLDACANALYLSRQVHIALGRNATRLNRFLISSGLELSDAQKKEHPALISLKADMEQVRAQLPASASDENPILLVDPLGNIMMHYGPEHTGKQMLKDLEKLLKASKIG